MMMDWAKDQLETVLGKALTGLIGVFALGVVCMWSVPKFLVTQEAFGQKITEVKSDMNHSVTQLSREMDRRTTVQALEIIRLRIDGLEREKYDLLEKMENQGSPPTIRQQNRLEEVKKELEDLRKREEELTR
jgi:hypothetical protein